VDMLEVPRLGRSKPGNQCVEITVIGDR
jgi:hypothetical protein